MNKHRQIAAPGGRWFTIFLLCLMIVNPLRAQDPFTGTWRAEVRTNGASHKAVFTLYIGIPEQNQLFPARLTIACDSFAGDYDLLLAKKNARSLAIGKQKHEQGETPFPLGNFTVMMNGTLNLLRDRSGVPYLEINRMPRQNPGVILPDISKYSADHQPLVTRLRDALAGGEMQFKKQDTIAWINERSLLIFDQEASGRYFGILDTVTVYKPEMLLEVIGNRRNSNGIVSTMLNSKYVFEYAYLTEGKPKEDVKLDSGNNYLIFFAEDFGKTHASTGKLQWSADDRGGLLDYADPANTGATFIVAPIYFVPPFLDPDSLQNNIIKSITELAGLQNETIYYYPRRGDVTDNLPPIKSDPEIEKSLYRNATVLGNIQSSTLQVVMALWDDAVEDGDTISLNINGNWIVQGMPVKKRPQFISVMLEPGLNKILFIAENEGSIPPNTSMLEIIDGARRRSYKIQTDMSSNNVVNIIYEVP